MNDARYTWHVRRVRSLQLLQLLRLKCNALGARWTEPGMDFVYARCHRFRWHWGLHYSAHRWADGQVGEYWWRGDDADDDA